MNLNFRKCYEIFLIILLFITLADMKAQVNFNDIPMIGAEVFIEPGQSDENVESWFKILRENKMDVTRIRMFENYMKDANGDWDFTLFDRAFSYAEKYQIKVYANLFPATDFTDVGGFKFPYNEEHLNRIADYIKNVVLHFKQFSSLYGWVPINEPGGGSINDPLARAIYKKWHDDYEDSKQSNKLTAYNHLSFDNEKFLLHYNTWYLKWLSDEIRKYDKEKPIHVNNHQIFTLASQYDFPSWRTFLSSLGGSAHASWHFGFFPRNRYDIAISANSEILRSGAGNIPWMMTELQGGNNIYSGNKPICPTKEEISQWFWITIGSGSKGAIYWCLNPRASGSEAGEWAMVDFQNKPADRLVEAGRIGAVIDKNRQLFAEARPLNSKIHVIYIRESMWVENRLARRASDFEARQAGAVMKSALSFFEAFSHMGLQPSFEELGEFDFSKSSYKGHTMVLSNQIAIPETYDDKLRYFVRNGGQLIIDGLTGYYDENAICRMMNDFPLEDLFGGNISEFKFTDNLFQLQVDQEKLPSHALKGYIVPVTGKSIGFEGDKTTGLTNQYGRGRVIWIPSLVGLGTRIEDDFESFIRFLRRYVNISEEIHFEPFQNDMLMKTLKNEDTYISIIVNKSDSKQDVKIIAPFELKKPTILFSNCTALMTDNVLSIESEETVVISWSLR
ncbi:MAG: hypothetical protein BGO33_06410 [Bacteroidia bacterium 43-41]|nr:MAG: hypothetical protein BGO33_06410 [Bacteroidia bacterium 43-41]